MRKLTEEERAQRYAQKLEYQREYKRETRKLLKDLKLCADCKNQDAYTLAGRTRCYDCAAKDAKRRRERVTHEQNNLMAANIRQKRKESGCCTRCGRKLQAGYNRITCQWCIAVRNRYIRTGGGITYDRNEQQ